MHSVGIRVDSIYHVLACLGFVRYEAYGSSTDHHDSIKERTYGKQVESGQVW